MEIKSTHNLYRGINAHLHSALQNGGHWTGFHTVHISSLVVALRRELRHLGYSADVEESVQIRQVDTTRFPRADILISDPQPETRTTYSGKSPSAQVGEVALPLEELLVSTLDYYKAISIHHADNRNKPVAWIELLSPTNKPNGRHAQQYFEKRQSLIEGGLVFVELDYLHESPPTFPRFIDNGRWLPYRIAVINPRPSFVQGEGRVKQFGVDTPIPTMTIPLDGDDRIAFDFDAPYQKTFTEMLYGDSVDYGKLPLNFERYTPQDQQRIASKLVALREAQTHNTPIESPPENVPLLPLEEALNRLK